MFPIEEFDNLISIQKRVSVFAGTPTTTYLANRADGLPSMQLLEVDFNNVQDYWTRIEFIGGSVILMLNPKYLRGYHRKEDGNYDFIAKDQLGNTINFPVSANLMLPLPQTVSLMQEGIDRYYQNWPNATGGTTDNGPVSDETWDVLT